MKPAPTTAAAGPTMTEVDLIGPFHFQEAIQSAKSYLDRWCLLIYSTGSDVVLYKYLLDKYDCRTIVRVGELIICR